MSGRRVILLGPQRDHPTVRDAVASLKLEPDSRVAVITAGWEEREPEDLELDDHLGSELVNLKIYQRGDKVFAEDPELHRAMRERHDLLRELQRLYRLRLLHALEAAQQLMAREGDERLLAPERSAAIEALRDIDAHHFARVVEIHGEFEAKWKLHDRPSVAPHREELREALSGTQALLIAGGHVGILRNRMRLFDVLSLSGDQPIIAWSAGAMVLSERVILFHDDPPQGQGFAEVFVPGFGVCTGVVPLPHARRRLKLDDPARIELFARRFGPDLCATLDDHGEVRWDGARWSGNDHARRLSTDGSLQGVAST